MLWHGLSDAASYQDLYYIVDPDSTSVLAQNLRPTAPDSEEIGRPMPSGATNPAP